MSTNEDVAFNLLHDESDEKIEAALRVFEKHRGMGLIDWMDDEGVSNEINLCDERHDFLLAEVLSLMSEDEIKAALLELADNSV